MLSFYQTPLDVLYLVLTIGFGTLVVFLAVALFHVIGILKNVNRVSEKAKDTVDLINHYLWQPIKILLMILEKTKGFREKSKK
ncbi:hypothetical protein IPJ72_07235 [Candidatus Peregrinibacteria bacterium]|nr:MAG: hypothetical protein IPJ72_07235 [Candidatus Peregrinibacteria bacterium]